MLENLISKLREEFKGYHIEISLYPSGGMIEAVGCEECGTDELVMEAALWRYERGEVNNIDDAVKRLKEQLTKHRRG
jgi:hypothetical protein